MTHTSEPHAEQPETPKSGRKAAKIHPYHHGALPQALLQAAETVLRRDGLRSLTLRAIAREAGVSHTAPQHHFGDMAGVLSELAASGHRRLAAAMAARAGEIKAGKARRKAIAHGYVSFACDNPDLFHLMSRNEWLDPDRASLTQARAISARALAGTFDIQTEPKTPIKLDPAQLITMTAAWAYVHGLALLLIDNRLNGLVAASDAFRDARQLVDAAIDAMQFAPEPVDD